MPNAGEDLDAQIEAWRGYVERHPALNGHDVEELEDHLRAQVEDLQRLGLDPHEAFLVAVRRMGRLDALWREFAVEHSERLWKQLVLPPSSPAQPRGRWGASSLHVALGFAVLAAAAVKAPALFGIDLEADAQFYVRNAAVLVLPALAGYFAWVRRLQGRAVLTVLGAFALLAVVANVYPLAPGGSSEVLVALHLPVVAWFVAGYAYTGGRRRDRSARMDAVRFTGEWVLYYALLALGGGVLVGLTLAAFAAIGIDAEALVAQWLLPCGAAGAVVVAAYLVEAKQSVVENMAPVLTAVFTPLATLMLAGLLVTGLWGGGIGRIERDLLIIFDLLLVLVLGLHLYALSARDPAAPPGVLDRVQLAMLTLALAVDVLALGSMLQRLSDLGATPNRVAALGLNIVLLVNLTVAAAILAGALTRRRPVAALEHWQTTYLPVLAVWAAVVAAVLPPLFAYS